MSAIVLPYNFIFQFRNQIALAYDFFLSSPTSRSATIAEWCCVGICSDSLTFQPTPSTWKRRNLLSIQKHINYNILRSIRNGTGTKMKRLKEDVDEEEEKLAMWRALTTHFRRRMIQTMKESRICIVVAFRFRSWNVRSLTHFNWILPFENVHSFQPQLDISFFYSLFFQEEEEEGGEEM